MDSLYVAQNSQQLTTANQKLQFHYFLSFFKGIAFSGLLAALKFIGKKWFEDANILNDFLTRYLGSLNNSSGANGDVHVQILACDCSGETEEVNIFSKRKQSMK